MRRETDHLTGQLSKVPRSTSPALIKHNNQPHAGYRLGFREPVLTFVSRLTRNLHGNPEEEHSRWAVGEELVKTMTREN